MSDTGFFDRNFVRSADELAAAVRAKTFDEDIGQFSWTTADEHRRFQAVLEVGPDSRVLEVASGSGGPALFLVRATGCRVVGIDIHAGGIEAAKAAARETGLEDRATFVRHDAREPLPFPDRSFDAILSIDSVNHFFNRNEVFAEWSRVLDGGGRFLFTDATVLTGVLRRDEMVRRSPAMGEFLFTPAGLHESALTAAGFADVRVEDATDNIVRVAERWHAARKSFVGELRALEGDEGFDEFQAFLATTALVAREGRLSRYAYSGVRPPR